MWLFMSNQSVFQVVKAGLSKSSNDRFISQEEMVRLIVDESGVSAVAVDGVFRALQALTVSRFEKKQDMLIPGIMRIVPGVGGLTRRYVKIQSISETLKRRLK